MTRRLLDALVASECPPGSFTAAGGNNTTERAICPNTANSTTNFPTLLTWSGIPANTMMPGSSFIFCCGGVFSTGSGGNTLVVRIRMGTTNTVTSNTLIADSTAQGQTISLTNHPWICQFEFEVVTVGVTGSVHGGGQFIRSGGSSSARHIVLSPVANVTIDTTVDQIIGVTMQEGTGATANTYTGQWCYLLQVS